jgi:hypothetical protein
MSFRPAYPAHRDERSRLMRRNTIYHRYPVISTKMLMEHQQQKDSIEHIPSSTKKTQVNRMEGRLYLSRKMTMHLGWIRPNLAITGLKSSDQSLTAYFLAAGFAGRERWSLEPFPRSPKSEKESFQTFCTRQPSRKES